MADDSPEWTKFGRYALLEKIGSGGMAEIYRAKTFGAAGFEKEFAIKLILPSLVDDTEFVDMFINEAKLAVNLYHANIVQVFDLGELNDQYYIAMEFVHGKDLLDVLARCAEMNIKIPLDLVLFVAMEMLKGLDFAHRAKDPYGEPLNIIHRDVSPSNIMISYAGDVKVGDFGVAKAAIERELTESGTLKGKVGYMSPEQVMGEEIDARSDLFAASIVLFEALSMNRLFVGDSDLDVMLKVRDAEIDEALHKAQPLPGDLVDILRKGLTKHREERFQTAGEFYQALVDFCFQHSIKVTGSDLSGFMRRLFADEIEEEKEQRRSEPSGEALSRQMAAMAADHQQSPGQTPPSQSPPSQPPGQTPPSQSPPSQPPGQTPPSQSPAGQSPKAAALSRPEQAPKTPSSPAYQDTTRIEQPDGDSKTPPGGVDPNPGRQDRGASDEQPADPREDGGEKRYRYRDDSGLVFGPMGEETLVDLLNVRQPGEKDRISVDGSDWKRLEEVTDIDLDSQLDLSKSGDDKPRRRVQRQVSVGVDNAKAAEGNAPALDKSGDTDVMSRPPEGMQQDQKDGSEDAGPPQMAGIIQKSRATSQQDSSGDAAQSGIAEASSDASDSAQQSDESPSASSAAAVLSEPRASSSSAGPDSSSEDDASPGQFADEDSPVATDPPSEPDRRHRKAPTSTLQQLKDQYASYEGELSDVSIARILARLQLAGETGRLFVHHDGVEKSVFFREGEPIFIESNLDEELLGRFLRSRDVITQQQLDEALDRLDEWGGRLGDALVAIGAIPAHGLFEHLTAQMREKLLEIFTWEQGRYGYYENQEPEEQAYSLGLDTWETIVEGCRDRISLETIRSAYKSRLFVSIYRRQPPPFKIDRLGLRTREMRVVNELEAGTTLERLLEKFSSSQEETVYRTVYLLHQVEIFSFEVTGKVDLPPLPD